MDELYQIIEKSSSEERDNLASLVGSAFGSAPDTLCNHMRFLRFGSLRQFVSTTSWKQLVTDVAHIDWIKTLNGRQWNEVPTQDIEEAIVIKQFQDILNKLSSAERQEILTKINKDKDIDDPNLTAFIIGGGAMGAAKLSGFSIYILASTILGSLTSFLGITLPFSIYIGMSQAISTILGPVGWVALVGGVIFTTNQPNWHRLKLAILFVYCLRRSSLN